MSGAPGRDGDGGAAAIDPGWRDWPLERLEREYSPSSCVASIDPFLDAYRELSESAGSSLPHGTLGYGAHADETVEVFPAGDGAPLIAFVHGGYWQQLSARDSTFGAAQCVPRGIAWAAVDYTLAPHASLARIVDQCRRAVRRLLDEAPRFGVDPARVWLAGSSAGAHLAAMAVLDPARGPGGPRPAGALLLSGIYDLRPLVPTYVNRPLGLDDRLAWALSPLSADLRRFGPALVAWGGNETASFVAQSRAFAAALGAQAASLEVPGRNHFDVVHDLGDPATPLGAAVRRLIDGG